MGNIRPLSAERRTSSVLSRRSEIGGMVISALIEDGSQAEGNLIEMVQNAQRRHMNALSGQFKDEIPYILWEPNQIRATLKGMVRNGTLETDPNILSPTHPIYSLTEQGYESFTKVGGTD